MTVAITGTHITTCIFFPKEKVMKNTCGLKSMVTKTYMFLSKD